MKRFSIIVVVLASLGVPVGARASGACPMLHDPVGDVYLADVARAGSDVDITGLSLTAEAGVVTSRIAVRDLGAAPIADVTRTYEVSWRRTDDRLLVRATRSATGWTFAWHGSGSAAGALDGSVDPRGDTIAINVPVEIASPDGARLADVRVQATEEAAGFVIGRDAAPNLDGGARAFDLDGTCLASIETAAPGCRVLTAPPADAARPRPLRSVSFATTPIATVITIETVPGSTPANERWEVSWINPHLFEGREHQLAFAERTGEGIAFGYGHGTRWSNTVGWIDGGRITIVVPRGPLRLTDGTRLTDVRALWGETTGNVWTANDSLPNDGRGGSWVVGPGCDAAEVQACPISQDRAGDARYAQVTDEVPENYAGLDLRSIGSSGSGDTVTVAARVKDLRAPDPPGADVSGWTISWLVGDHRVYAQAERDADGVRFRYGARTGDGLAPSGPVFAGRATTGRLDLTANIIAIDVPRAAMPESGTHAEGMGATAWGLSGRHSGAVYLVWDETEPRPYLAGATCAA